MHYYYYYTRPVFQDNFGKPVPVWIYMRQKMMGFWDAVASAGPYGNYLHLASDR